MSSPKEEFNKEVAMGVAPCNDRRTVCPLHVASPGSVLFEDGVVRQKE